ncbi:MAG: hypothetical protein WCH46_09405 [bacterium]
METTEMRVIAHKLIDSLPDGATWKDLLYEIYVRQEIELGLLDSLNGDVESIDSVKGEFGILQ